MRYEAIIRKMTKKRSYPKLVQKVFEERQPEKDDTLIFWGVVIAMISIGLLIFVLSEKVFHLS